MRSPPLSSLSLFFYVVSTQEAYEASEIWLGKEADVGAHLTVPSVRGDRVLWMCGAHPQDAAPGECSVQMCD